MLGVTRKPDLQKIRRTADRDALDEWGYPSGMVWCPMKMSGMALMKCAAMQKQFGCGSLRQLKRLAIAKPKTVRSFWPWLRLRRECPARADDKQVRELRLALTPLRSVEKSRKNPRAYNCPACGGGKVFGAQRCRRCWRNLVTR